MSNPHTAFAIGVLPYAQHGGGTGEAGGGGAHALNSALVAPLRRLAGATSPTLCVGEESRLRLQRHNQLTTTNKHNRRTFHA
jgi:hypothetical protein